MSFGYVEPWESYQRQFDFWIDHYNKNYTKDMLVCLYHLDYYRGANMSSSPIELHCGRLIRIELAIFNEESIEKLLF